MVDAPVAVAVYIVVPPPWQRVELAPRLNTGLPGKGRMVTTCDADTCPPHPVALALIMLGPVQLAR